MKIERLLLSPMLYPLWRIGWIERAFFRAVRRFNRLPAALFQAFNFGFDISKWQGVVDFVRMVAYGARFLILRCAYGTRTDEEFETYIDDAAGLLPLSAYHFYDPVYSPIDQANKVIAVLDPYKSVIRRVWLDMEFWWSGGYSAPQYWKTYRDMIQAAGYKIGWYTRATWWDSRVGAYAAEFARDPLWAAQYNSALTLIPRVWTKAMIWQDGILPIGHEARVSSAEIDHDLWNDDFPFHEEWGIVNEPPQVEHEYQKIRRYNSDVHVLIVDPREKRVHVTNTHGALETVSHAALRLRAKYAVNGDGWYDFPVAPLSIAASDGDVYQDIQLDFRPFLDVSASGEARIGHSGFAGLYNTVSGTRYLVSDGIKPAYLLGTEPQYVEKHPRTAVGTTQDGRLVFVVVDGRSGISDGVTLSQLANILLEFGSRMGLELDGGGSSEMVVNGQIVNVPSDGSERAVINHVMIGQLAGGTTMDYYDIVGTDWHNHRVRVNHDVRSSYLAGLDITNTVHARSGATAEDVYTFPSDVLDPSVPGGKAAMAGDVWRKVYQVGNTPVSGWTAVKHLGVMQGIRVDFVPANPVPEPTLPDLPVSIAVGDDVTYIRQTVNLVLKPK